MELVTDYAYQIFTHEYFLVIYGLFLWHLIRWYRSSQATQENGGRFSNALWWKNERNEMLISFAFAPLLIVFDDELLDFYNTQFDKQLVFEKWMYLMGGFIIDRVLSFAIKTRSSRTISGALIQDEGA